MKTICDTNVWRKLALKEISESELLRADSAITVTFINIDEIAKSHLVLRDIESAKQTIRRMMKIPALTIFENPIIHLSKLGNPELEFNNEKDIELLLKITEQIAKGCGVLKKDIYEEYIDERNRRLQNFCASLNERAELVRKKIKNFGEHRNEDIVLSNRLLISKMVESATSYKLQEDFDWQQVELFEKVFSLFAMNMETVGLKIKPNDVYDLLQLAYVQPKDKFWTFDKRILGYINEVKMEKYLFNNNNNNIA